MNTSNEPGNSEKALDYRQEILSKFHQKQKKHLTSTTQGESRKNMIIFILSYSFKLNKNQMGALLQF